MVVAQTSVDKLGGTPPAVQLTPLIAREHVVAVLEGAKLHLQARMVGSQWLDTRSRPTADPAEPVSGDSAGSTLRIWDSAGIKTAHLGGDPQHFGAVQGCRYRPLWANHLP
jgi:hypothetical protein